MPPKKKVHFNLNVDVKRIPAQGRGRRVPPPAQGRGRRVPASPPAQGRGRRVPPPPAPPPPPLHPPTRFLSTPSPSRPPRPRPLRRYAGMKNLTKIPKQKGGAFTREMGKKLFFR